MNRPPVFRRFQSHWERVKGRQAPEIDARDAKGREGGGGGERREIRKEREKDENLRKKSELIGSECRGQTILEAAVISRDAKETSQSDALRRVLRRRSAKFAESL